MTMFFCQDYGSAAQVSYVTREPFYIRHNLVAHVHFFTLDTTLANSI